MLPIPSIQLDSVTESHLSATRADLPSSKSEPFSIVDGEFFDLRIDSGVLTTFTFHSIQFADITAVTVAQLVGVLGPFVTGLGGELYTTGSSFGIRSLLYGSGSAVEIGPGGTATSDLGLATGTVTGVDVGADTFVANRNPQPNEVQIPLNASIVFDFFKFDGVLPALSSFVVTIAGVVAYSGGSFQNSWTGTVASGSPDNATTRFTLVPPTSFASGAAVMVSVVRGAFSTSWTFYAYDLTPPLLLSVLAVNKDQVRVEFNEPVSMEGSTVAGDALNPASYVIERRTRPATTPVVTHVDRVDDSTVLLTTSFELSFGAGYMLVVTGISDEFGNVFAPPGNVAEFSGWLPPFPAGRRFLLHDFVPKFMLSSDSTDELRLFLGCMQDTVNLVLYLVDKWAEILDPDTAPEPFLDAMLADLGNPFAFDLDVTQKRKLAKLLVRIYQLKGTVPGIINVVRFFLGVEVTVQTFNGAGWRIGFGKMSTPGHIASPNPAVLGGGGRALYSFRVLTTQVLADVEFEQIATIATYMKGAQEHLVGVRDGATVVALSPYWKIGLSKIGYVKLAGT